MTVEFKLVLNKTQAARTVAAFTATYGYQPTITDLEGGKPADPESEGKEIPNPESEGAFTKRKLVEHVKNVVKSYESQQAIKDARDEVINNFELGVQ